MKKIFLPVVLSAGLMGCVTTNNQSVFRESDLRHTAFEYTEANVHMDFASVQRQLFTHREACQIDFDLKKDPLQVHFATLYYGPAGVTDLRDRVMFDLTLYASGKLNIKGYSYRAQNKNLVLGLVPILSKPTVCPDGIETKIK